MSVELVEVRLFACDVDFEPTDVELVPYLRLGDLAYEEDNGDIIVLVSIEVLLFDSTEPVGPDTVPENWADAAFLLRYRGNPTEDATRQKRFAVSQALPDVWPTWRLWALQTLQFGQHRAIEFAHELPEGLRDEGPAVFERTRAETPPSTT